METGVTRLSVVDIVVVAVYFVIVIAVGIYASCTASKGSVSGYFLAGRRMTFITVGASLFVSNIGSQHFIGLAGSGSAGGIGVGAWEFNAILLLQLLGFIFVPVYIASQIYTMPSYLNKRFGGKRLRIFFAMLSLILYIFTKCSVDLYTGALFIQQSLGWDLYLSIFGLIAVVAVLTITGGLTAVIYTDTFQAVLMIFGASALTVKGFHDIGGFDGLWSQYPLAVANETVANTSCHEVNEHWNVLLRPLSDTEMPWLGFLMGQTPGSIWYWCTDQASNPSPSSAIITVIVQRSLAAKSLSHAQGATLLAGLIKTLPLFIMVMPGMISRVLYPNEVACSVPEKCYEICQSYAGCSNIAYPKLVLGIMPIGARGLMMAVMIAALMSDLDSIFNSASTLFTIDIYKHMRKNPSTRELLIAGRIFVVVMTVTAIAWVPVVKETQGGQVFLYIQEVTNYLVPPVACVFLLAVLWPRCNEKGAFWGLMAGFLVGAVRLVLLFAFPGPDRCGDSDERPAFLRDFQYMYFAVMLFWLTCAVSVVVSLLTDRPDHTQVRSLFLKMSTFCAIVFVSVVSHNILDQIHEEQK
ncbi:hypothetical protein CAPTEDRAFT_98928 [Capitella teleta]|uniref:Sodium/myo-inositol cotransporter n=1 Tax=Capitella teleta TaxID=283909 RepID=R7TN47_CAPTE|nr:hypothetical protein CAPTEDRAFT_98928 [Capitella teleta]|eukprot:ELT92976.1 hypothetical protein CAPTEDRAFT_98928 [Capitella teleta]